jgi:hypothetical protein
MESAIRAPQIGDMVFVFAKMNSGKLTTISGPVREVSTEDVYVAVDAIEYTRSNADDDGVALDKKIWPESAAKFVRVCVPLDKMKLFQGTWMEDAPCWEVRV